VYEFKVGATPGRERKRDFVDNPNGLFSACCTKTSSSHRRVIVPPEAGYGKRGQAEIPPNTSFELNLELLKVTQPEGK
ncbi:peptidyl-prolyl cis-trans isomerase FKBP18, chloroplastic, partial [Tanacetum coccineum]